MIRCTKNKCKLFSEKKGCKNRDDWGICKLPKSAFDKLIKADINKRAAEKPPVNDIPQAESTPGKEKKAK